MLDNFVIMGGAVLDGSVKVSGAKNSVLPILFSTLLTAKECRLTNVPNLEDISVTARLLESLGAEVHHVGHTVSVKAEKLISSEAPYRFVKALRASFWLFGPLIARTGAASVSLPGGDAIGSRPVDLHLQALMSMGADIRLKNGVVYGTAPGGLHPERVRFSYPSVGATHQIMMTATLVPGETVIEGAACEPEVVELAAFLSAMGAHIEGAGTPTISIQGREYLNGTEHEIEGDRIEAATFLAAAAITGGRVTVRGIGREKLSGVVDIFEQAGCSILSSDNTITLTAPQKLSPVEFSTNPFPGVATDAQPLLMAMLCRADGISRIEETVFDNRFGHVAEFRRFGAHIELDGRVAHIHGNYQLTGAPVQASDIRAGAGLVIMGLGSDGRTEVGETLHLDRGYEYFVDKLRGLGGQVTRVPVYESRELTFGC